MPESQRMGDHQMIIRVSELRASGASEADIRHAVAGLQRVAPGAYATTSNLTHEQLHLTRARAVTARLQAVVCSHTTAAVAWGLPVPERALAKVQLSPIMGRSGNPKSGSGYRVHYRAVDPQDAHEVDDLMVTDPMRTVLECPRVTTTDWAVVIADAAIHARLVAPSTLIETAAQVRGIRGAERVRALAGLVSRASESPGETLLRLRLRRMGLDVIEQQPMPWVEGNPRVDFLVEGRLVVEFDGRGKYDIGGDPARAHWAEKRRHDRIVEAGYEVIHVTWDELWDERALARRIHAALARAHRRQPSQ